MILAGGSGHLSQQHHWRPVSVEAAFGLWAGPPGGQVDFSRMSMAQQPPPRRRLGRLSQHHWRPISVEAASGLWAGPSGGQADFSFMSMDQQPPPRRRLGRLSQRHHWRPVSVKAASGRHVGCKARSERLAHALDDLRDGLPVRGLQLGASSAPCSLRSQWLVHQVCGAHRTLAVFYRCSQLCLGQIGAGCRDDLRGQNVHEVDWSLWHGDFVVEDQLISHEAGSLSSKIDICLFSTVWILSFCKMSGEPSVSELSDAQRPHRLRRDFRVLIVGYGGDSVFEHVTLSPLGRSH